MAREDKEKNRPWTIGADISLIKRHHLQGKKTVDSINLIFDTDSSGMPLGHLNGQIYRRLPSYQNWIKTRILEGNVGMEMQGV